MTSHEYPQITLTTEQKLQIRRLDYKRDSLQDIFLKAMEEPRGRV